MPRKGSRASRAAKTKEQALSDDDQEGGPSSPVVIDELKRVEDEEMAEAPESSTSNQSLGGLGLTEEQSNEMMRAMFGNRFQDDPEDDDSHSDDDDEQDSEDDEHDRDEDDDDHAHDYDEEEEEARYQAELAANGGRDPYEDEEGYGDSLSDLLGLASRSDVNGDPITPTTSANSRPGQDERSAALEAAMDAADAAMERAAASGILGGNGAAGASFRSLHGLMQGMSTRLKGLLATFRNKEAGASAKLVALQDLAELLSVSTEDTLAGYFQVEAFVREIINILRGDSNSTSNDEDDANDGEGAGGMTREEMIAFGIDPSSGGSGGGGGGGGEEKNVQMMLLACRCLANLMEALPGSAHSVVYAGAVPVLCAKLMEIQYIDLAEQTMIVSFRSHPPPQEIATNDYGLSCRRWRKFRKKCRPPLSAREDWERFLPTSTSFLSTFNELLSPPPPIVVDPSHPIHSVWSAMSCRS
jgi:E3 ubiquitin-protein ligase TRIP12